jgi:hypothetical protein
MLPLPTPKYPKHPLTKRPQIGPPARPNTTLKPTNPDLSPDIPNACNTSFDAIASIRRDIFIFKGKVNFKPIIFSLLVNEWFKTFIDF